MLDRRPLSSDRSRSAVGGAAHEPDGSAAWRNPAATGGLQPRVIVGLALIVGGIVWAAARGLHLYGFTPVDLAYDLDQPPLLLALVGGWLIYRSRPR